MGLSRLSIIKLVELALTLTCLGLHYQSFGEVLDRHSILIINGTFVGFSIILIALFAGYLMNTPINKRLDIFFSIIGGVLFILSGIFILQFWNDSGIGAFKSWVSKDDKTAGITKGTLAVINGIVFFIDVVFTFRD